MIRFYAYHMYHMCSILFLPVQSLLMCFRSSLALRTLSLITLPQTVCFIAFSSSPTAVPCLLLAVQYYTVAIPSEPLINDSHKCLCSTEKLQYRMLKSLDHTHYRYVRVMYMLRVMEMYMETFHIKKMADLHVVTVMLSFFELSSFRENGFLALLHFPCCSC